jgi:hypothetical protein
VEISHGYREQMKRRRFDSSGQRAISGAFLTNLRLDMPLSKKVLLIIKNQCLKIKIFETCCQQPGEPAEAEGDPLVSGLLASCGQTKKTR